MKKMLQSATLLVVAVAMIGCVNPEDLLIFPCYDNKDRLCDEIEDRHDGTDLVCNMAVTVADECQRLIDELPDWILLPDICEDIPETGYFGTCQVPGLAGDSCAEAADCQSGVCDIPEGADEGLCQ